MSEDTERTEPATAKKRQEFRDRGEVAKSRDLAAALGLLAMVATMGAAGEAIAQGLRSGLRTWLDQLGDVQHHAPLERMGGPLVDVALAVVPLLLVAMVAGVVSHLLQTGLLVVKDAIKFDLARLNPLPRLTGVFSIKGIGGTMKSIVKLALVGVIVYRVVKGDLDRISALVDASPAESAALIGSLCLRALGYGGFALFLLGAVDYAWQRYALEKKMRMSKQEVKDEHKRQEGDPLVKMRIRAKQREISRQRMIQAVKTADVVVTNPTHIAVALKYDPGGMGAPRVVAKGKGVVAERIKAVALESGVPVMENVPLARALVKAVKVGREIPPALFKAVAEVLAYVYGKRRKPSVRQQPLGLAGGPR